MWAITCTHPKRSSSTQVPLTTSFSFFLPVLSCFLHYLVAVDCARAGVVVEATNASIVGSTFTGNGQGVVFGGNYASLSGSRVGNNTRAGVSVQLTALYAHIEQTVVEYNGAVGVEVQGAWATLNNSTVRGHSEAGVRVACSAPFMRLAWNNISDNADQGLALQARDIQLVGNRVWSNHGHGVAVDNSGQPVFVSQHDVIYANSEQGIAMLHPATVQPPVLLLAANSRIQGLVQVPDATADYFAAALRLEVNVFGNAQTDGPEEGRWLLGSLTLQRANRALAGSLAGNASGTADTAPPNATGATNVDPEEPAQQRTFELDLPAVLPTDVAFVTARVTFFEPPLGSSAFSMHLRLTNDTSACNVCECVGTVVSCRDKGLTFFPRSIPPATAVLDLSVNNLRDVAPSDWQQLALLPVLRVLNFSSTQLSSLAGATGYVLPTLENLDIAHNRFTSIDGLASIVPVLQVLTLTGNSQLVHAEVSQLPKLVSLTLDNCRVASSGLILRGLPRLESLSVRDNGLADLSFLTTSSLPALLQLDASDNDLRSPLAAGSFSQAHKLQTLILASAGLRALPAAAFQGLTELLALDLQGNPLANLEPPATLEFLSVMDPTSAGEPRVDLTALTKLQACFWYSEQCPDGFYRSITTTCLRCPPGSHKPAGPEGRKGCAPCPGINHHPEGNEGGRGGEEEEEEEEEEE